MKKRFFDLRLYREGLRQLKLTGLIYAFVMVLLAVLPTLATVIGDTDASMEYDTSIFVMFPYVILVYCVFAPIMALTLFHFLDERNASDFYHSIPQTRVCLFASLAAAVLTFSLSMQWGATLLSMALHAGFPDVFCVSCGYVLKESLQVSAAVVCVVGAVLLGMSLTGTLFTNLVVSLIIIFVPRGVMFALQQVVGDSLTVVAYGHYLSFFGNDWNVVTGGIFGMLYGDEAEVFGSLAAGAYTVILGIVYLVLACLVFARRKSEAAGNAALGRKMQVVIRLIPATVFCLIPDAFIFQYVTDSYSMDRQDAFTLFELYLVGVIIYFIYELVSTRKWKNVVKAAPGLLILAAVNFGLVFGMMGMEMGVLSFSPSAEEIAYVCLPGGSESSYSSKDDYLGYEVGKIKISDDSIKELVAGRLAEGVAYDSSSEVRISTADSSGYYREVLISTGKKSRMRQILLSTEDLRTIAQTLENNAEVESLYMDLPDIDSPEVKVSCNELVDDEDAAAVYAALKQDIQNMGFEEWYVYCSNTVYDYYWSYDSVAVYVTEDGATRSTGFLLSDKTPLATREYLNRIWDTQSQSNAVNMRDALKTYVGWLDSGSDVWYAADGCDIYLPLVGDNDNWIPVDLEDEDEARTLLDLFEERAEVPVASGNNYIFVSIYLEYSVDDEAFVPEDPIYGLPDYTSVTLSCYLSVPDDFDTSAWSEAGDAMTEMVD